MSLAETLLQTQPQKFGLWPSVWKLLRLRLRVRINTFKRSSKKSKIGSIVVLTLLVAAMVGLFWLSGLVLNLLQRPELAQYIDPTQFINAIPTLILTAAFLLTLMTNFGVLLQSLYLSHDMDFLVTSPLPMRAVFLAKLVEAILPTFGLFCAFSVPVLFGIGTSGHYTLLYFPLLIVLMVLLALAAGGLASILVMAVVRVVPARRVAEVLGLVGAITSVICGQSGNIIRQFNVQSNDVGAALNAFTTLNATWFPLAWAGRGLIAVGQGEWLSGLAQSLLTLAMGGVVFAGTLFLAEQLYYTGWASMQGSTRKKRAKAKLTTFKQESGSRGIGTISAVNVPALDVPTRRAAAEKASRHGLLPAPMRGLIVKDLLMLRRDTRNLSQLITPLVLGFVMFFSTRGGGARAEEALSQLGFSSQISLLGVIVLTLFVGWILLFNLTSLAFTREGRNYWMIKAAPMRALHLIAAKYIVSYIPAVVFCLVYLVIAFLIQGVTLAYLPFSAAVVALSMAGASGISLAYGITGANLEWEGTHRQRLKGGAGCMVVLVVIAFLGIDLILFSLPIALWQIIAGSIPSIAYWLGLVLGGAAALIAMLLPLRLVVSRLRLIGEAG